jgi:hypothetical protein
MVKFNDVPIVRFGVFTAVRIEVKVFWVVTPCGVVGYQCFRGVCCLHLQGEDGSSIDLGVDGKIKLKWILGKQGGKLWTGCIWLRIQTSGWML